MSFVDGFVAAVPTANKKEYLAYIEITAEIFKDYGALQVVEAWGNEVPDGEITSFPMAVKAETSETVVFSWVVWPSKEVRDSAWPKIVEDPRMNPENNPMPFDGKRIIYGGFDVILDK
ncbi:DUF1428 domain-containing protein [Vibrio vulnificus]|nr:MULTISPECIES: DUF1428 domain-containing protein [Vibrio]EGS1997616.1 DUF1428 domain-containing protein [Vibrio vulnificus]EHV9838428.1 DUF1428 domain-containing protein [Vibrio vulnificus]EIF3178534.1 DUF1428 domain-containing protein [Vibrio vulnificus]EIJ0957731.1 DUF1428 domain-containing protein [Vibrio vulnificus]EIJ0962046.1 DUF1428 domain-containing protein [Vibrio vulnificus]